MFRKRIARTTASGGRRFIIGGIASTLAAVGAVEPVSADIITSPDGQWVADLDAFGQVQTLFLQFDQPNVNQIFEHIRYEATSENNQLTRRIEDLYIPVFQDFGPHSAFFRLESFAMSIEVNVTMLNGATGGVATELTWENTGTAPISLKAFDYVDFDISGVIGNERIEKLVAGWRYTEAVPPGTPGKRPLDHQSVLAKTWEADMFPLLRTRLDNGIAQLTHTDHNPPGTVGDWTTALSWEKVELSPGQTYTIEVRFSSIPSPGTLGLLALGGLFARRRRR